MTEDADAAYVKEEARINKIPVRQVENLPAEVTYPVNKLLLTGDPADMPHVEELMQQEFAGKLSICRSAPFFIETMPLGVGKDTSLEILLPGQGPDARQPDGLRRRLERPADDTPGWYGRRHGQRAAAGQGRRRLPDRRQRP